MSNDPQPRTEQPASVAPAAAPPPEWAKQQERLVDAVQRLVGVVAELTVAIHSLRPGTDDTDVDDEIDTK